MRVAIDYRDVVLFTGQALGHGAPDLPSAVEALLQDGVEAITVWPMFLGTGRHAREDLPRLMEQLRARHARVRFTLRPAIAEHPDVLQAMACAALEPGAP